MIFSLCMLFLHELLSSFMRVLLVLCTFYQSRKIVRSMFVCQTTPVICCFFVVGLFCYFCVSFVFMVPLFSSLFDFYFVNDNEMKPCMAKVVEQKSKVVEFYLMLCMSNVLWDNQYVEEFFSINIFLTIICSLSFCSTWFVMSRVKKIRSYVTNHANILGQNL